MKYPQTIEDVKQLDDIQKLSIYMHYFITSIALQKDFDIEFNYDIEARSTGDYSRRKESGVKQLNYYWKDLKIKEFDEFISDDNIIVTDNGENWKENGQAQRIRTDYTGIYDWYYKFEREISLV